MFKRNFEKDVEEQNANKKLKIEPSDFSYSFNSENCFSGDVKVCSLFS